MLDEPVCHLPGQGPGQTQLVQQVADLVFVHADVVDLELPEVLGPVFLIVSPQQVEDHAAHVEDGPVDIE